LFIRMFVFFIDDDQTEIFDWRENGRACADDNSGAALSNLLPFIVALAGGEMAVQNGHHCLLRPGTKTCFKALDRLGCKRNLRHKNDCAATGLASVRNRLEINLSFTAAGNAVQKKWGASGQL